MNDQIKHQPTDVTIFAAPFGFGPLGKAMAIAHVFEDRGISVKVLTDDIGQKIVKASGLTAEEYKYKQELDLATLNTKVAISSLDISTPIKKSGVPLALYDSLFWLRGTWEHLPKYNEDIYIAQDFFAEAPQEAYDSVKDHLHMVDAVLPRSSSEEREGALGDRVVLYPGGLKSPHLPLQYQEQYLAWAVEAIKNAMAASDIAIDKFSAIIPPQLADSETANSLRELGATVESAVDDLGKIILSAKAFIIAPGIETMLESCALGKIPLYLPAYIAPHVPQLIALRKAGVGKELCPTFNDEVMKFDAKGENMGKLSKDMLDYNSEKLYQRRYQQEIEEILTAFLKNPQKAPNRYPLGKDGASQVVDIIEEQFLNDEAAYKQDSRELEPVNG